MTSTKNVTKSRGLLLVGHGTRSDAGQREFSVLGASLAELLPDFEFQAAFLELASPDLPAGIQQLVDRGVREIVVVPALLFAAGHAKRDIPRLIEQSGRRHPDVQFSITGALECNAKLLELSEMRFRETADVNPQDATLLMVGRGSNDAEATEAMHRYARLFAERLGVAEHHVAFMAMAKPALQNVLDQLANRDGGPLVVQPHLLFPGELLSELRDRVAVARRQPPKREILVANHLGAAPLLAEALAELAQRVTDDCLLDKSCN